MTDNLIAALERALPILAKRGIKDDEAWGAYSQAVNALVEASPEFRERWKRAVDAPPANPRSLT